MGEPVIRHAAQILVHAPDMLVHNGSVQVAERSKDPDAEYLKKLSGCLRPYAQVVDYAPNQCYIGNRFPVSLRDIPQPWYENSPKGDRFGRYGEIMPEDEFYLLMKYADTFELVQFTSAFIKKSADSFKGHPFLSSLDLDLGDGTDQSEIEKWVKAGQAEGLYMGAELVGCVKQAHDSDETLCAHVILENLATKASSILAALWLGHKSGLSLNEVDYIIECSEEACGDINQRGGGNFAKAIGEKAGCLNATGSDVRAFCAAPSHAFLNAAALVKSGIFRNVLVVAGGATAKLGMNGRDHVKKDMPVLEDVLGGFAFLIGENDGKSPIINTRAIGRHTIQTGSSPQAVMTSLITMPLDKVGMSIKDVDLYSVEMQNPEITKPAGAGDVPEANYKMIAALGVMQKKLERDEIPQFVLEHGMPGFAPTQGHIPSGVPFIGHAIDLFRDGKLNNCMIVGKGSLFLGRMTNLFDGVSFLIQKNSGNIEADGQFDEKAVRELLADAMKKVALTMEESE